MMTIKDYATIHNVSYEAVRKQVKQYYNELLPHIVKKGRTSYLDDTAVSILDEHRKENPIIISAEEEKREKDELVRETENLRNKILMLQQEIIELQKQQADYIRLSTEHEALKALSSRTETDLEALRNENVDLKANMIYERKRAEDLETDLKTFERTWFGLYRKRK